MNENNFKKLAEEAELKFANSSEAIKKNVVGQKNLWTLIGDLIELYIPKIFSTLTGSRPSYNTGIIDQKGEEEKKI